VPDLAENPAVSGERVAKMMTVVVKKKAQVQKAAQGFRARVMQEA
jgi:hypothetical protein